MAFGRDPERRLSDLRPQLAARFGEVLAADPARLELVDAATLRGQAAALGLATAQGSAKARGEAQLVQAALLLEHGRRTGAPEDLAKAALNAEAALKRAAPGPAADRARLIHAASALAAAELYDDADALRVAEARLAEAAAHAPRGLQAARVGLAQARAAALRALLDNDAEAGVAAAERCDAAVTAFDDLARRLVELRPEAALAHLVRAELLTAFAARLRTASLAAQAADDLAEVSDRLDPDAQPLTVLRVETARAEALLALGELEGDAQALAEAAAAAESGLAAAPEGWSPVDRARCARALGLARQALAEATQEAGLYDRAMAAFDLALAELEPAGELPLRGACAFDRALALARRAETAGDVRALDWAQGALKARLAAHDPVKDPVAWAALQVALARLYILRADATGETAGRGEAALALEAALEVFTERGLKSLAEQALAQAA